MLRELEHALPADAMVSTDIGNICQIANSYLRFERPRSMFGAMMFGNCGYAFPAIIGCKAAAPERPAVAYVGDGAWGMSFGELLTCVRETHPGDRRGLQQPAVGRGEEEPGRLLLESLRRREPREPELRGRCPCDGRRGRRRVEKLGDVGPALRDACAAQRDGRTTVLEIMVTRELGDPFRRDALKLPKRLLPKYKAYQ